MNLFDTAFVELEHCKNSFLIYGRGVYLNYKSEKKINQFIEQIKHRSLSPKIAGVPLNEAFLKLFFSFVGLVCTTVFGLVGSGLY